MEPGFRLKDVNDHSPEVNQHPFPAVLAFDARRAPALGERLVLHVSCQRRQLPAGFRGGDDDPVEHRCDVRDIEDCDVACLDFLECADDGLLQLANVFQWEFL